jgi:hypothetical protein
MDLSSGAREFADIDSEEVDDDDDERYKSFSLKEKFIYQLKNW